MRKLRVGAALILALMSSLCAGQEITVAAAADLQFAMQDVATRFQKQTGKTVKVIYGSSGLPSTCSSRPIRSIPSG